MKNHFKFSDEEFEREFANCTLDPTLYPHEAHLRIAWIYISKYGIEVAVENISRQLKNYVVAVGAKGKYHETVTITGVKAVYHFMLRSKTNSFPEFIDENKQLLTHFKDLLSSHYRSDIFRSEVAKTKFIQPESEPFD